MAISVSEQQVTWDTGSNSKSVAASGNATSDAMTKTATTLSRSITCKADNNAGTPAANARISFYALYSCGDPDGASTEEYDTPEAAELLCTINTGTNGSDPRVKTVRMQEAPAFYKIYAKNLDSTDAVTVSACVSQIISS